MPTKQPPELTYKIISTYADDTPENRARFMSGIRLLNEIIDDIQLENLKQQEKEEAC